MEQCDDAVTAFMSNDMGMFHDTQDRLHTLQIGNIKSLLNIEVKKLEETEGDKFNQNFNLINHGDLESEDDDNSIDQIYDQAPQLISHQ